MTKPVSKSALSETEKQELQECEEIVHAGMQNFVEVGTALLKINDQRLYRETHSDFDSYVREKWSMSSKRAYQLCQAAEVVKELSTIVDKPTNEAQARALSKAPAGTRAEVLQKAKETAPDGKLTAKHIAETITPRTAKTIDVEWIEAAGKPEQWGPGGVPVRPADHKPEDDEPDAVFGLKRYWKQATKKERQQFMDWAELKTKTKKDKTK